MIISIFACKYGGKGREYLLIFPEDDSQQAVKGAKGNGKRGKGAKGKRGKAKGKKDEDVDTSTIATPYRFDDHVDLTALGKLAGRRATMFIDSNAPKDDGTDFDKRSARLGMSSLRHALYEYKLRADAGGNLPCLYRVSKSFEAQGVEGARLLSGVTDQHDLQYKNVPEMARFMGAFKASRSVFVNRKELKEYVRGGSDGPCRDFDVTKSFTRARANRAHGLPAEALLRWIRAPDDFAAECGLSVEHCKAFITASPTSGRAFVTKWLASVSLVSVPPLLTTYAEQVKRIGEQDITRHPDIVQAYMDMGCDSHSASTKTSYQLDCQFEWGVVKRGIEQVQTFAKVRALELDGIVVSPARGLATPEFELQVPQQHGVP